jgi:cation transport regulator ChaC
MNLFHDQATRRRTRSRREPMGVRIWVADVAAGIRLCASMQGDAARLALRETTVRYLREREQVTAVYLERSAPITLECGERVLALTYVADRLHRQYAGRLDREAMLGYVLAGEGQSGANVEYVLETYDHLRAIGVRDRDLEWLSGKLRGRQ